MEFLLFLQNIRNPILNVFFSAFTMLGEEAFCIALICYLYYCKDKKVAIKTAFSFLGAGLVVQALKIALRVPRPWVLDSRIQPLESAIETATGYSFPSGHTQTGSTLLGTFAFSAKKLRSKIFLFFAIAMVALSRMYLGVHTISDVTVSFCISILIVYAVNKFFDRLYDEKYIAYASGIILLLSFILVLLSVFIYKTTDTDAKYISDCLKAAGASAGFAFAYYFERKYVNFDPCGGRMGRKLFSAVLGIAAIALLRAFLKALPMQGLTMDFIRYGILMLFAALIYPYFLKRFERIFK